MSTGLTSLRLARALLYSALCAAPSVSAQIYGSVASDGSLVLSNFRSAEARDLVVDDGSPRTAAQIRAAMPDPRFSWFIDKAAEETRLPRGLLHAVIAVESGFDPRAISPKGAKGLMQLMPATALALGVTDPFDPGQNITAGATHLKLLLERFDNNLELALAAYNAGADAVVKAGYRIPQFAETRAYVPRVLARLRVAENGATNAADTEARRVRSANK